MQVRNNMLTPDEIKLNRVLHGKNQDVLKDFPSNFFDSIITDPPYELGFMSKKWDATGVAYSVEMWQEVLRVSKPGATLFCFGGTRTYHRVACAIEDAGWIIKDSMMWVYGSGFPKSTNISKQLDKEAGKEREVIGPEPYTQPANGGLWKFSNSGDIEGRRIQKFITKPATDIAKQWTGYGTALKPSFEPIILAMKPLEKGLTYAQNARKHGVAGLNIDAGRIGTEIMPEQVRGKSDPRWKICVEGGVTLEHKGHWPANVILSHSPDCVQVGTKQINKGALEGGYTYDDKEYKVEGFVKDCKPEAPSNRGQETIDVYACVPDCPIRIMDSQNCTRTKEGYFGEHGGLGKAGDVQTTYGDSGGASRFFYCAKASRSERESGLKDFVPCVKCGEIGTTFHFANDVKENCLRNPHPTIKPLAIMEYLCKLIKMPERRNSEGNIQSQVILDPFCGSGSTLLVADKVGLKYIGIDMGIDNVLIASSRSIDTVPDNCLQEPKDIDPIEAALNAERLSSSDFEDLLI